MPIAGVILAALLAWGAWNTMATANAVSTTKFDGHVQTAQEQYNKQQNRIVDKLDKIQQTILDLHKGE